MKITTGSSHSSAKLSADLARITSQDGMSHPALIHSGTAWCSERNALGLGTRRDGGDLGRTTSRIRLCIATAVGTQGLLADIQRSEGFCRLYLMSDPTVGVELAFASPGLDEMGLVTDLIVAMRRKAMLGTGLRAAA